LRFENSVSEGLALDTDAVPVPRLSDGQEELGRAGGHELDVIIGVLAMERWEIKLDFEGLKRREFTEF